MIDVTEDTGYEGTFVPGRAVENVRAAIYNLPHMLYGRTYDRAAGCEEARKEPVEVDRRVDRDRRERDSRYTVRHQVGGFEVAELWHEDG